MKPTINPIWFYWSGVADNVIVIVFLIAIVFLVGAGYYFFQYIDERDKPKTHERDRNLKVFLKNFKQQFVLFIIFALIASVIPNKDTLTKMIVFEEIKKQQLPLDVETVEQILDHLFKTLNHQ